MRLRAAQGRAAALAAVDGRLGDADTRLLVSAHMGSTRSDHSEAVDAAAAVDAAGCTPEPEQGSQAPGSCAADAGSSVAASPAAVDGTAQAGGSSDAAPSSVEGGSRAACPTAAVSAAGASAEPEQLQASAAQTSVRPSLVFSGKAGAVPCRYLLDSGAEAMCVSAAFVEKHGLITHAAAEPVAIQMPDGTTYEATQEVSLTVRLGAYVNAGWRFKVVPLVGGTYDAVLGMPFLHLHNPRIDWQRGLLTIMSRQGRLILTADSGGGRDMPFLLSAVQLARILRSKRKCKLCLVCAPQGGAACRQAGLR